MGEATKIQWADHTFNPWRGCAKVSPGCANCYAERQSVRNPRVLGTWGKDGTRPVGSDAYWRQPLAWNRAAAKAGERHRVFCASLADVFEDRPDLAAPRGRLFDLIDDTPSLNWLLLTKRPENIGRLAGVWYLDGSGEPVPNVWLGTTVEDQQRADERIPHLLRAPAAVRFLSVEPLLGPVDLTPWLDEEGYDPDATPDVEPLPRVDWVIVGGESGPRARPCDVAWIRDVVRQCREAGVPCFVKQLGARPEENLRAEGQLDGQILLDDPKGGDPAEWPEDLRVRQVPGAGRDA